MPLRLSRYAQIQEGVLRSLGSAKGLHHQQAGGSEDTTGCAVARPRVPDLSMVTALEEGCT